MLNASDGETGGFSMFAGLSAIGLSSRIRNCLKFVLGAEFEDDMKRFDRLKFKFPSKMRF